MADIFTPPTKSRGRPKSPDPRAATVTVAVTITRHAAIVTAARQSRVSVSEYLNRSIARTLVDPKR